MVSMHRTLFLAAFVALVPVSPASAQSGANVLLVVNETYADSGTIAAHYARVRSVPPDQVLRVKVDATDEMDRAAFNEQIQAPIAAWLRQRSAQDRILYIVLAKGIPLRCRTPGRGGTTASVTRATLLYRRLVGHARRSTDDSPILSRLNTVAAKTFSRATSNLTSRSTVTVRDVTASAAGRAPVREGRSSWTRRPGPRRRQHEWLTRAADQLAKRLRRAWCSTQRRVCAAEERAGQLVGSNDWADPPPQLAVPTPSPAM
jgi:uncharacterized protein (TIGR03790 family)